MIISEPSPRRTTSAIATGSKPLLCLAAITTAPLIADECSAVRGATHPIALSLPPSPRHRPTHRAYPPKRSAFSRPRPPHWILALLPWQSGASHRLTAARSRSMCQAGRLRMTGADRVLSLSGAHAEFYSEPPPHSRRTHATPH